MESMYTELALFGSKNECARTDNVFFPISEVFNGTVSLSNSQAGSHSQDFDIHPALVVKAKPFHKFLDYFTWLSNAGLTRQVWPDTV